MEFLAKLLALIVTEQCAQTLATDLKIFDGECLR